MTVEQTFYGLCFSPDGRQLFASGGEYEVVLRDETRLKVSRGYREKLQAALQAMGDTRSVG